MENRIQVKGKWYVLESEIKKETFKFDPIYTRQILIETDNFSMEFSVHEIDSIFKYPIISFHNKIADIKDYWDNENWILGIYKKNKESFYEIKDLSDEVKEALILIVDLAYEKGYLENYI